MNINGQAPQWEGSDNCKTENAPPTTPHINNKQYEDNDVDGWGIVDDRESKDDSSANTIQQDNQDKVNTIWSDKTSVIQLRDMNKEVFPKYDSYQLMIPLEEEDLKAFNDAGYRDNFSRIKEILAMLVTHIRIFDEKAGMITWKEERYMSNAI